MYFLIIDERFCSDHTSQVQQSVLMAPQQLPRLSEAVGGAQEDECHWLGRKNPGAGEKPLFTRWFYWDAAPHVVLHRNDIIFCFSVLQVYEDVSQCCQALSQRLGTQPFFFNKQYVSVISVYPGVSWLILSYCNVFTTATEQQSDLIYCVCLYRHLVAIVWYYRTMRENYQLQFLLISGSLMFKGRKSEFFQNKFTENVKYIWELVVLFCI